MRATTYIVFIFLITLTFTACQSKNTHHGLYNALFYDYNKSVERIEHNLSIQKLNEERLTSNYDKMKNSMALKKKEVEAYNTNTEYLYKIIEDINNSVEEITLYKNLKWKLAKVKKTISKMKYAIIQQKLLPSHFKQKSHMLAAKKQKKKVSENIERVLIAINTKNYNKVDTAMFQTINESKKYIKSLKR